MKKKESEAVLFMVQMFPIEVSRTEAFNDSYTQVVC